MEMDEQLETIEETGQTGGELVEESHDLEEVIEMEIADEDIYAYLVDEDDNEIGFVLIDENGDEQEYYYVDMSEYEIVDEIVDAGGDEESHAAQAEDDEEFDLGITREGVAEATDDLNAIYRDGAEVAAELKATMEDINEGLSFLKKR